MSRVSGITHFTLGATDFQKEIEVTICKEIYGYLNFTGSFESVSVLGGGLDFRYFSWSMNTVLQFFSSLTSSQS